MKVPLDMPIEFKSEYQAKISRDWCQVMWAESPDPDQARKISSKVSAYYALELFLSAWRDHFLARISELGREGWQLAEPMSLFNNGVAIGEAQRRFEFSNKSERGILNKTQVGTLEAVKFVLERVVWE